ncbi:MAG: acyl-CoA dehydrogenase family protein [bacterium]
MRFACRQAWLADFESGGLEVLARDDEAAGEAPPRVDPVASGAAAEAAIAWLRAETPGLLAGGTLSAYGLLQLGNQGLLGLQIPREIGGLGLTWADACRVIQQAAAVDLGLGMLLAQQAGLGVGPLLRAGSEAQRDAWLPALARGRALATLALTEAAGSHGAVLQGRLVPAAEGAVLTAEKVSVPLAPLCALVHVVAREGEGFTAVVVPREAARVVTEGAALGAGLAPVGRISLDGVPIAGEARLGEAGQGLAIAASAQADTGVLLAAAALGAGQRALQLMYRFAGRRAIEGAGCSTTPRRWTRCWRWCRGSSASRRCWWPSPPGWMRARGCRRRPARPSRSPPPRWPGRRPTGSCSSSASGAWRRPTGRPACSRTRAVCGSQPGRRRRS